MGVKPTLNRGLPAGANSLRNRKAFARIQFPVILLRVLDAGAEEQFSHATSQRALKGSHMSTSRRPVTGGMHEN